MFGAKLKKITVEPAIFSYFLAIYFLFSVFQPTVFNKVCSVYLSSHVSPTLNASSCSIIYSINSSEARKAIEFINKETNHWIKITTICNAVPSLLVDCLMGGWSDVFGRKLPMFLPGVGGVLSSTVYLLVVSLESMGVEWLCLASFLSGIFGGVTSVIANCFSYVAALAEKEERTLRVSVVEGMQLVAAMAGPFLSKLIKQQLGTRAVFAASGLCYIVQLLYCFTLREPTSSEKREKPTMKTLFSPFHIVNSFKTIFVRRKNNGRRNLRMSLISLFIVQNVISGESDILYIFLANINTAEVFDYFFGFRNFVGAFSLLAVLPILKRFLKLKDETIALISLASYIGGLVFFGLSYNITMIFLSACVGFGSRMADSLLRSLVSHQVNDDEIGKVFGVVAVQGDLSLIIGSLIFNSIFTPLQRTTGQPGAAYLVGGCILLLPLLLTLSLLLVRRHPQSKDCSQENGGFQSD